MQVIIVLIKRPNVPIVIFVTFYCCRMESHCTAFSVLSLSSVGMFGCTIYLNDISPFVFQLLIVTQ